MRIVLFDYGVGNLHSLAKALAAQGAQVTITAGTESLAEADALVLPGVGAFGAAAKRLAPLRSELLAALDGGMPCLGICLGMQLLCDGSDEGNGAGLGVIPGRVRRLDAPRIPHMGWNAVETNADPIFAGLDGLVAYYANSYAVQPADNNDVIAWTDYDGTRFAAAVRRGSVWGVQFHPEKSGRAGLRLIANFVAELARC